MTYKDIERRAFLIGESSGEEKGIMKGIEKGIEKGIKKGEKKGRKEMADARIAKGLVSPENLAAVIDELENPKQV